MVLWQGVRLTAIGAAIGLALSLGVTQLLGSLLFGVSPLDPVTYGATLATLAAVTLAGTFVAARTSGGGRSDYDAESGLDPRRRHHADRGPTEKRPTSIGDWSRQSAAEATPPGSPFAAA